MTDPDFDDQNDLEGQQESHDIRRLREKASKYDKTAQENEQLRRQIAFSASGVDITSPVGELFAKAYDGAPTVEAVKESAIKYGVLAPPAPVVTEGEQADLAVIAQVATSNNATTGAPSNTITPDAAAGWGMDAAMRFARTHPVEWEALKRGEDVLRP